MPEKRTLERARKDKQEGKAPTTQAGEFVREEMDHVKRGKHGVKNRKQAVAIGLSKARQSGVDIPENPNRREGARKKPAAKKSTARKSPAKKTAPAKKKTAPARKKAPAKKASKRSR